jgi:hypothetical protein
MPGMLPTVHSMMPAMLVLIVPAFVVCVVITAAAWRRRGDSAEP